MLDILVKALRLHLVRRQGFEMAGQNGFWRLGIRGRKRKAND